MKKPKKIIALLGLLLILIPFNAKAEVAWGNDAFRDDFTVSADTKNTQGTALAIVKEDDNKEEDKDDKKPSKKPVCSVEWAYDTYKPTAKADYDNKKITFSVRSGKFKVYVIVNGKGNDIYPNAIYDVTSSSPQTFTYDNSSSDQNMAIAFVLNEEDSTCGSFEAVSAYSDDKDEVQFKAGGKKGGYLFVARLEIGRDTSNDTVENSNYNGICKAFREGNYNANEALKKKISKEDFDLYNPSVNSEADAYYRDNFNYCYYEQVSVDFNESAVATMLNHIIKGFKMSKSAVSSGSTGVIKKDAELISPGNPDKTKGLTNIGTLSCPAYRKLGNGNYVINDQATAKSYYIVGETNKSEKLYNGKEISCNRKCMETITIDYGPPVATRGGLCFEYKVKVRSEVNCETKVGGEYPKYTDYKICNPAPGCNHGSGFHDISAGPNEDFNTCIYSCDGGKFSQSCIDSCYEKVYENKTTLPLAFNGKPTVKKVADTSKNTKEQQAYYDSIIGDQNSINTPEKLREAIKLGGHGRYEINKKNGSISWNNGNSNLYWDYVGRYYIMNQNATSFIRQWNRQDTGCYSGAGSGENCRNHFIYSHGGFARANWGSSICGVQCIWIGCPSAVSNIYYGYGKSYTGVFVNYEDIQDALLKDQQTYEEVMNACEAAASCSTTTATFTIKVNNKVENKDGNNYINYDKATLTPGNGMAAISDSDNIILDRDFCYNDGNNGVDDGTSGTENRIDTQKYMTEWSFPGTWINNKTGEISYEDKTNDTAWHEKKDKFCTSLNSSFTNQEWWKQIMAGPSNELTEDKLVKENDLEYNIQASTTNFGYYDWNASIQCFYAIYDKSKDKNTSSGSSKTSNSSTLQYRLRSVDLEDVFPSTEGEQTTNTAETGRDPGFNWTDAATNLKNSAYRVTPGALTTAVQSRGNTIYQDKDQYLDYEFILDKDAINKIRNSGKSKYALYDNTFEIVNGVSVYKSNLISELASTRGNVGCNNDGTGSTCETIDDEYTKVMGS